MQSFLLFFSTLALLPASVLLYPCPIDTCPCIRRGTFDSAWLTATYPALATTYKDYTFSAPNITYPNCSAIIATCPSTAQVARILDGVITIGGALLKNPFELKSIVCDENHQWIKDGVNQPLDDNIKASNISCATKI